jgi:methylated-DNA-[protein]-cysteine S-methyltransferase
MMGAPERQGSKRRDVIAPSHTTIASPLGDLRLVRQSQDLVGLYYPRHRPAPRPASLGVRTAEGFYEFHAQLGEYLAGVRRHFDLTFRAIGRDQDQKVWGVVAGIPYGEMVTYGQIARELGEGTTAQEVGAALARNPLCIVIPCHRVIRADGQLAGYAGGLARKRFLLELEERVVGRPGRLF